MLREDVWFVGYRKRNIILPLICFDLWNFRSDPALMYIKMTPIKLTMPHVIFSFFCLKCLVPNVHFCNSCSLKQTKNEALNHYCLITGSDDKILHYKLCFFCKKGMIVFFLLIPFSSHRESHLKSAFCASFVSYFVVLFKYFPPPNSICIVWSERKRHSWNSVLWNLLSIGMDCILLLFGIYIGTEVVVPQWFWFF